MTIDPRRFAALTCGLDLYIGGMAFFQSKHLWVNQLADGVAVLVLDRHQAPQNFLDPTILDDLNAALDAVIGAKQFRLLVIRSAKAGNFCHGPPTTLLASWSIDDFRTWCERGQQLCNKLSDMPIPSVSVIAGTCFDAGLELALACDHRIVVDNDETALGFPELEWGMIPSWGGTQRLPHVIGLDHSLHMLLAGERFDAREAWTNGLADDLESPGSDEPPAFLVNPSKRDWSAFPRATWRQRWLESNRLGRWFLFRGADRIVRTRIPDEMPAPGVMLGALRHVYQMPNVQAGLEYERQAIQHIAEHPALHEMLRLLLHRFQMKLPSIGASEKSRVRQIGVIGGNMAALALYMHSVARGYDVVLRAADRESLALGMMQISQLLEVEVQRGSITKEQLSRILGGFRGTYTWTHFDKLHLILDTVECTLPVKQAFYQEMEKHAPPGAAIVPISSAHRIEDLQHGLLHPARVVGLHLIEPWNRGSLAEIVASSIGSQPHVQRVREWLIALGKCCLQVPDHVGGLVMRIWLPALNEAGLLVKEGVPIDRIDLAMRRFGNTFGPLEWMDRIGIDEVASLVKTMQPVFAGRITFESGFGLMVERQWLGAAHELGFYEPGIWKPKAHRAAAQLWRSQSQGEPARHVPALSETDSLLWIQERLVTLMVLEAVRCLEGGLAKDADDLDCAMCLTGWATHRGGPIGHGRHLGVGALTERCTELASTHGPRFAPIAGLREFLDARG